MEPDKLLSFPFLTRKMLEFEHAAAFSLVLQVKTTSVGDLTIRGATREGAFVLTAAIQEVTTLQTFTFRIPDIPIWISITDEADSFDPGNLFTVANLSINGNIIHKLASGYVYANTALTYPITNLQPQVPVSIGQVTAFTGANPAANVEASITTPSTVICELVGARVTLVTDANAANRRVHLDIQEVAGGRLDFHSSVDHAASLSRVYTFVPIGAGLSMADDNDIIVPIAPGIVLGPGGVLATLTTNRQTGDDFGSMVAWVKQWLI